MAWAPVSVGAPTFIYNTTLTPAMPASVVAGNLLILHTGEYQGSDATPTVAGYTLISPGVHAQQTACFARIATATSADNVSIFWGNQFAFAYIVQYSGGPSTLTGIIHASIDKVGNSTNSVQYAALSITQPNCLILAGSARDKTATSNGATYTNLSSFTQRQKYSGSNTGPTSILNDWIQTTATSTPLQQQTLSIADATNLQYQSYVIALYPAAGAPVIYPIPVAARQTFVNEKILQY